MRVQGYLTKSGRWWAVEIPLLLIHTQGRTKKDAYAMAKDAIELMVDKPGFQVTVAPSGANEFTVASSDDSMLMAFALKQLRAHYGQTIRQVAQRMGSKSPRAYAKYEDGSTRPSLEKFANILRAISEEIEPVLTVARKIG